MILGGKLSKFKNQTLVLPNYPKKPTYPKNFLPFDFENNSKVIFNNLFLFILIPVSAGDWKQREFTP